MKHVKIVLSTLVGVATLLSIFSFTSKSYHKTLIIHCYKVGAGGFYVFDPNIPPSGCIGGSVYCGFCFIVDQVSNGYEDGKVSYDEAVTIANGNMGAAHGAEVANHTVAIYRKPF